MSLDHDYSDEEYNDLLPSLKRYFYLETKLIHAKSAALPTEAPGNENEISLLSLKGHLVSSYHLLVAQERALKVTTLTSLIEYTACSLVSAGLGILAYIEGSTEWATIGSFILFALALAYKAFGYTADVLGAWFQISEADYKRLLAEAREYQRATEDLGEGVEAQGGRQ